MQYYKDLSNKYNKLKLDTWTTVSALNVNYITDIQKYCRDRDIRHSYAFLDTPEVLNVKYTNWFTLSSDLSNVATEQDNTKELEAFLELEEACRPNIERFWT